MSTGWRFEDIEELTLYDLRDLNAYWDGHPPVHLLVAAYMGALKETKRAPKATPESMAALASAFGLKVKDS